MFICRFLITSYKIVRQNGMRYFIEFVPRWLWVKHITFQIRRLYFISKRKHQISTNSNEERPFIEEIVTYGLKKVSELKKNYANLYANREDLRFLINIPPSEGGAPYFYFFDLSQCLQHAGIHVHLYTASEEDLEKVLPDFRPSVFLTCDCAFGSKTSQLESEMLHEYKKQHGLARLYIPHYLSPLLIREASSSDLARISLHRSGKLADAFFGYFEDIFWDVFCKQWKKTDLKYYSIPFAANPIRHYPILTDRDYDWGIATANLDVGERAGLTYKYMNRIIRKYKGVIAGHNWGKGIDPIPPNQIAQFFARVKISPNIAAESNVRYPLDCGAKVHELSAMGVFQLASEIEALRKYYSPAEIVAFRSPKEFNALFDYFVDKPQVRQMYLMNSMARTFAENTYFQRIEKLIKILDYHAELF